MRTPRLHRVQDAYVADTATVTGDVRLGRDASVWYGTIVRGDVAPITIGARTNLQDLTVVHPEHDDPVTVGDDVVVGHGVLLHCRTVGSRSLVGMGSILLPRAIVGERCLVAAGSLVPPGMAIPDGTLVRGSPARVVRSVRDDELRAFRENVARYLDLARRHAGPDQDPSPQGPG